MRRAKRRSSRALVGILTVTIAAGTFAAYKKLKSSPAGTPLVAVSKQSGGTPIAATPAAFMGGAQPLVVTQTPASRPAQALVSTPVEIPKPEPRPDPVTPQPLPRVVIPSSGNPLADGKSHMDAGDLVTARAILNDALFTGKLTGGDADAAKEMIGKISETLVFGRKVYKDDAYSTAYTVQLGDRLQKLAASNGITWELLCRINGISDPRKVRAAQTLKLIRGPFHAVVTKSRFTMDIYLGDPTEPGSMFVRTFRVGLGKDDSTPAGKWMLEPHKKLKHPTYYSPRGEGVIAADDPKNPLGAYWMALVGLEGQAVGKASYGIHGTINPDSIGKQESMGCIRMLNDDVALVFELLVDGKSTVLVKD